LGRCGGDTFEEMTGNNDAAGVFAPPPFLLLATWTAAHGLHRIARLRISQGDGKSRRFVGGVLVAAGVSLSAAVVMRFADASTPISPLRATRALVIDGPYRYSRNPDYLGQALVYTGVAISANRLWPLILLPAALALITSGVIEQEEDYLGRRFGAMYREYADRVPRWL
jgi:protein-S-isoprenylcysteine O-methyltransferase Ste14